jgi:hypothetical protein
MNRRRIRFGLKTMLIIAAIVAAPLGYTQWRRQSILREAQSLEAEGFYLLWDDPYGRTDWPRRWLPDWLWPVVPKHAAAKYDVLPAKPTNRFRFGTQVYTDAESLARWVKISNRLREMGVEHIRCDVDGKVGNSGVSTK